MKKLIALVVCLAMACSMTACAGKRGVTDNGEKSPKPEVITDRVRAELDAIMRETEYQGIAYLTHNGKVVYEYVSGTNDIGQPLTIESPMYICSISKHFCAVAVLMLRDQGKLSLGDTLEKYFPEYTIGKDITLKQMLSMRSGICENFDPAIVSDAYTYEETIARYKEWLFEQELQFRPDSKFRYSNNNYRLLSLVVEQVTGQSYEEFVHQNIFAPLGMTHSGFLDEIWDNPQWGLTDENLQDQGMCGILFAKGAGGIVTTAGDMDIWMSALPSGELISRESYEEMTTDYSNGQSGSQGAYGYGLMRGVRDGWGHGGGNMGYTSKMYFNEEYAYNLFVVSGNTPNFRSDYSDEVATAIMRTVFAAEAESEKAG